MFKAAPKHRKSRLDMGVHPMRFRRVPMHRPAPIRLAALVAAFAALLLTCVAQTADLEKERQRRMLLSELNSGGMMFFEGGKYAECIEKLEKFLGMLSEEEKGKVPLIYLTLGEAFYRLGKEENFSKAISYWTEFLRRWPADPKGLEVKLAIAQTHMQLKAWDTAITWWVQIEGVPALRENALTGQATCYRQLKKPEEEIKVLDRLVNPDFNTPLSAEGAVRLMSLYALKHDPAVPASIEFADRAIVLLKKLQAKTHLVENLIALNSIAIKLGDELIEVNAHEKALDAYWAVRSRDVVAKMQRDRIVVMELRVAQNIKGAGKDPIALSRAIRTNDEVIKPRIEEGKKILAQFEALPDFMPALYFRMARCFADLDRKWEAIVIFNQILTKFPKSAVRELVIFSRLAIYADLGAASGTYRLCDEYIAEFAKGPHAGQAAYIKGITAMKKQDWYLGEKYLGAALKILATLPEDQKSLYWTEARYQYANSRFLQNKFEEVQKDFDDFIRDFGKAADGKGAFMEDVEYQLALTHLFLGHYDKDPTKPGETDGAIERLTGYMKKWGLQSSYASDAKYRLAVCRFAANEHALCAKECQEWLDTFGKKQGEMLQPEVYALLGDARAGLKEPKESAVAYIESTKRATTDEVLTYSLFEAGKQLQKAGDWEGIEKLYTDFVKARADHQAVVTAMYWVGKAKSKLGRMDEAKQLAVQTLAKYIGEPRREGIELMLGQLAEWSRRRPPSRTVAVSPDGEPAKWDADAELERMLKPLREKANPTTEARLLYASAELAKLSRKMDRRDEVLAKIAEQTKAADLSSFLLMEIGDFLFAKGNAEKAETFYRALKDDFPKATNVDAGYVGLGEIELARKELKKAMELFTYAIDRLGAPYKLKEALIGQAKCHMATATATYSGYTKDAAVVSFEKARKLFEEVAGVREWRGESTAYALYQLAEIQFLQGKWPEATALFERVAVSQQKYPTWAARAYNKVAEGYQKMGKKEVAKDRLKEMLKKEKFQALPEAEAARKKLAELGGAA
jgi:tetratricopeptide (TPR) repeat protein